MSTETLTVNGGKAGEKKTILLPSRPKKRLFIGMLLLVTLLAAVLLFGIWYIGVPGLERIQPLLPWAIGALLTGAVLLSFFGIFNMLLAVAGLPNPAIAGGGKGLLWDTGWFVSKTHTLLM